MWLSLFFHISQEDESKAAAAHNAQCTLQCSTARRVYHRGQSIAASSLCLWMVLVFSLCHGIVPLHLEELSSKLLVFDATQDVHSSCIMHHSHILQVDMLSAWAGIRRPYYEYHKQRLCSSRHHHYKVLMMSIFVVLLLCFEMFVVCQLGRHIATFNSHPLCCLSLASALPCHVPKLRHRYVHPHIRSKPSIFHVIRESHKTHE